MSVAFTREESAERAAEVELPSPHLAASEFGDRVGTGGADQWDDGKSHCL
jgi:hypothetical protein